MIKKKDLEINELKRQLERSKEKEVGLFEKIEALEERNNEVLKSYENYKSLLINILYEKTPR